MQLEVRDEGKILIVKPVIKRLDASIAPRFKVELVDLITKCEKEAIILNLDEVDFIDSSGLAAIIACLKALGRKRELLISNAKDNVLSVFKITKLDKILQIFPTEKEAIMNWSNI